METIEMSKELLNDLNYYKIYSKAKDLISKDIQRQSPHGKIIERTFIFTLSPTNIYNRFKRQFDNKLKWFKFTPHNIAQLSINKRREDENLKYVKLSNINN